jgi:hypothetical protein
MELMHHYLEATLEEKRMSHGGGVFASNNKEKKTMAMALDSSKALSSSSHNCTTSKQQTTTTRLNMSSSSSSFSHFTLSYMKNKMTTHKFSYVIVLFMHLHYNKTINDDDTLEHVILLLFVFCIKLQPKKNKDDVGTLSLCCFICVTTKKQMTMMHSNASSLLSSSLCSASSCNKPQKNDNVRTLPCCCPLCTVALQQNNK